MFLQLRVSLQNHLSFYDLTHFKSQFCVQHKPNWNGSIDLGNEACYVFELDPSQHLPALS